jgi:ubiquinone/menaquinone biosynthesis C-methylase UbiE/uncharacterized protein YbaR (Trm112 family)
VPKQADYYDRDRAVFLDWVGGRHERILDVGCGSGSNARWYRQHGAHELVGIEIDPPSADKAVTLFDRIICAPVETAMAELDGPFDLIVCADVLEHLVDPWTVVTDLRRLSHSATVLAVSMPNIRFLGAIARIAVGPGFRYEDEGIFDVTHVRFFTGHDLDGLLRRGGWRPERRGSHLFGRLRAARRMMGRMTHGWSDQWLAEQQFVVARPDSGLVLGGPSATLPMGVAGKRMVNDDFAMDSVGARLEGMYQAEIPAQLQCSQRALAVAPDVSSTMDVEGLLACPVCRESIRRNGDAYACTACDRTYPIVDGIPIMIPDVSVSDHDEIDHLHGRHLQEAGDHAHKAAQTEHFDRGVAEEFEISRPHGTPRLYSFLLSEKFQRATRPIGSHLIGARALTVCGGSGMDAEFLARAGARVICSDLSLGAARRTRERARRYGLDVTPIVADVERLPFADRSFDLVLVHDGLHHLERPGAGLAEMARTSRRWVSVSEPAQAAVTAVAIRAGLALEREEAGNRVARLTPEEVEEALRSGGFQTLTRQRYAMFYRHEPGRASRVLSGHVVFPLVRAAWRLGNAAIGRAGNKLVVVAERQAR